MDHRAVQERLSEYLDGELSPREEAEVRAHLDGCESCRAEEEALRRMLGQLSGLKRLPPPPDFLGKVQQRIRRRSRGRFFAPENLLQRLPFEWISFVIILLMLMLYMFHMLSAVEVKPQTPGTRPPATEPRGTQGPVETPVHGGTR